MKTPYVACCNNLREWVWLGTSALAFWTGAGAIGAATGGPDVLLPAAPAVERISRPLRYRPDGTDFVIENGSEFFNRPLYCLNSSFRIDGGDKPEFSLYLPGRGGNLRLGLRTAKGSKWLNDAKRIITRYRPGSLLYEIQDPLMGRGVLKLAVVPVSRTKGLVGRVAVEGDIPRLELVIAYGGANGLKGNRGGDIGCETEPVGRFFQLRPEECRGNTFTIASNIFFLRSKVGTITGVMPPGTTLGLSDANSWDQVEKLLTSAVPSDGLAVASGKTLLEPGRALYFALLPGSETGVSCRTEELPAIFEASERHRQDIANRVVVETPDPFLNAAASALCVAADGVWDARDSVFMHGAVAWRTKFPGWRGPYAGDALGWHDRTRKHLVYYAARQNTNVVRERMPPADASVNLTRNEAALHSNGDISNSHYDMNLVAVDALLRHLLWTGDLEFAERMWPVLERHLAWERRLFRRPFGPDSLPLYEAYCCIWASDNLQYDGGGATHASAYNYYHNKMAARLAKLLGKDPAPYEREAELIAKAMQRELWLPDRGWFAECRDYLGMTLVHPNPALWTFYHAVDSEVPTPMQAWEMTRFVDTQTLHIPLQGPGVPAGEFYTLPTTSWMPYLWSLNNVVMAEVAHTSLGFWQAGRPDAAMAMFKGCLLDSMYLGLCPGNVGMCTWYDAARGESQRDFADGIGMTSRALVEGLFGVRPDALAGELTVSPGFPADWTWARLKHPDLNFEFRRKASVDTYIVEPKFVQPMGLKLAITAPRESLQSVTINAQPVACRPVEESVGAPRVQLQAPPLPRYEIVLTWNGKETIPNVREAVAAAGRLVRASFSPAKLQQVADPEHALGELALSGDTFTGRATGRLGHRTVFANLRQGDMSWWSPVPLEIRPALEVVPSPVQEVGNIRFRVRNNSGEAFEDEMVVTCGAEGRRQRLQVPALGESEELALSSKGLLPGSIPVRVESASSGAEAGSAPRLHPMGNGVVTNWKLNAPAAVHWEPVDLSSVFNDEVTRIFRNNYLSPRSPFCSLQTPRHGLGGWCDYNVQCQLDDSGLRAVAARNGGRFELPQGIPLQTPGSPEKENVAFVSQWDNYPREVSVALNGKASHAYLLVAGSTGPMQSRFDNGEVIVTYADGATERLALENPTTWWPIEQDYYVDHLAFPRPEPSPLRVDLKTGEVRTPNQGPMDFKAGKVAGGAATVLDLPLKPERELKSLMVRALANEVVIGLMSVTLARE